MDDADSPRDDGGYAPRGAMDIFPDLEMSPVRDEPRVCPLEPAGCPLEPGGCPLEPRDAPGSECGALVVCPVGAYQDEVAAAKESERRRVDDIMAKIAEKSSRKYFIDRSRILSEGHTIAVSAKGRKIDAITMTNWATMEPNAAPPNTSRWTIATTIDRNPPPLALTSPWPFWPNQ